MKYNYETEELFTRYPALEACRSEIIGAADLLDDCYKKGGKILLCGNGGSCADCDHITGELLKGFLSRRELNSDVRAKMKSKNALLTEEDFDNLQLGLPAISLCSLNALNTAFCNDVHPDYLFAQGTMALGKPGDILICISTSGNSKNVVNAAKVANAIGMNVISLTGAGGGKLGTMSAYTVAVPETETFKVQELHLPVYHYLCAEVEKRAFN